MRRLALVVILLVALAVAVVAFLPASLVDGRLAAMTEGRLRVADAAGTVWSGRGTLADASGTWRIPFRWRIDPLDVLRGKHEVTLLPPDDAAGPRGVIGVRNNGVDVRDLALEAPASALAAAFPTGVAPTLGGTLGVTSPAMSLAHGEPSGTLDARWTGARIVAGDAIADLGTVHLAAKPQGNGLAGTIANDGGNVRVEGTLTYASPTLAMDATLTPAADAPPTIVRLLAALGAQDSAGRTRIVWRGNVR